MKNKVDIKLKADELAEVILLTPQRVRQLSRAGTITRKTPRGPFDLVEAVQSYIRYLKGRSLGDVEVDGESHEQARARLTKARADIHQRTALQLSGQLVPVEQIEASWTAVLATVRQNLIALPDRVAPRAHDAQSLNETREFLKEGVHEILKELAETKIEWDPVDQDIRTPSTSDASVERAARATAASKANGKRME